MTAEPTMPVALEAAVARLGHEVAQMCPLPIVLLDEQANVKWLNKRAIELAGSGDGDLIGRSIMEFVYPDDLPIAAEVFAFGLEHREVVSNGRKEPLMGPLRLRMIRGDGQPGYVYVWGQSYVGDPELNGILLIMAEESSGNVLAEAISDAADGAAMETSLATVVRSVGVDPLNAYGAIITYPDESYRNPKVIASLGAPNFLYDSSSAMPWVEVARTGAALEITDLRQFGPEFDPERTGVFSLWCRAIPTADASRRVLVVCTAQAHEIGPGDAIQLLQIVKVAQIILQVEANTARLEYAATHDRLTGLANREHLVGFDADLTDAAVLFIDLDQFKTVNDTHGHTVGDAVLRVSAERIKRTIRSTDLAVRIGGDEFVVVSYPRCSRSEARAVAQRIVDVIAQPISVEGQVVTISASVGVAMGGTDLRLSTLIRSADKALLNVKSEQKGTFAVV